MLVGLGCNDNDFLPLITEAKDLAYGCALGMVGPRGKASDRLADLLKQIIKSLEGICEGEETGQ